VNLAVEGAPASKAPATLAAGNALASQDSTDTLRVSNRLQEILFDKHSGTIQSWRVHGKAIVVGGPILNLGEAKASGERAFYRAPNPPVTDSAQVTAAPASADGTLRVSVTSKALAAAGGAPLGTLTSTYDIKPDAEIVVNWNLDWTADNKNLWEAGMKISMPTAMTQMSWQRDACFTDYPDGHVGEPSGSCRAGDVLFRASKRNLHWLKLADTAGTGVVLLPVADMPLIGRADSSASGGKTLFASREVAGPRDFSGNWVSAHDIKASKGSPLSGAFTLRAVAR
jgi:hypothetical protein